MKTKTISEWNSIAPRFGQNLDTKLLVTAENCDITDTGIKPVKDISLASANTTGHNSMVYYNGAWVTGDDRYFMEWRIGDYEQLFYLKSGVLYKQVNGIEAIVGQETLSAPTVALNGAGSLTDTFTYFVTTTRDVNGFTDESGPSDFAEITASSNQIRITQPTISDSDVTYWNIYRSSLSTGEFQFVAQVAVGTTTYDDNTVDTSLGSAPTVYYTSDQGNLIITAKPAVTFDGIADEPIAGIIFAWKGSTLYFSDPGFPDRWPAFYSINFPSDIKRCIHLGGALAVLTERGPFTIQGSNPELLDQVDSLGREPCIGLAAAASRYGVWFLSDSGMAVYNLTDTEVVSDSYFTESYFADNIDFDSAFIVENDGIIYLFHSAGVLVCDIRTKTQQWTTLDIIATAAAKRKDTGDLYYLDSTGVQLFRGGTIDLDYTIESGDITLDLESDKDFLAVEMRGSGAVTLTLNVDGTQKATKAINFNTMRGRRLGLPEQTRGRALTYKLVGTASIESVSIEAAS